MGDVVTEIEKSTESKEAVPGATERGWSLLDDVDLGQWFPDSRPLDFRCLDGGMTYLGPAAHVTQCALTGRFGALRDWQTVRHGLGKVLDMLKQKGSGGSRSLPLPEDAVVGIKARGKVVIVLSRSAGFALKLERHPFAAHSQHCAMVGDQCFKRAGLAQHAPELLSSGVTASGAYHTTLSFVPNWLPLFRSRAGRNWPLTMERDLLPILQPLYQKNGMEVLGGNAWSEIIESKLAGRTLPPVLSGFWNSMMDSVRRSVTAVPVAIVSGDLQPQNIHYHAGQVVIFDWSNDLVAAVALDFFCELLFPALREPDTNEGAAFWDVVRGARAIEALGPPAVRMVELYRKWLDRWLGVTVTRDEVVAHLRGTCLDWFVTMNHLWSPTGKPWRSPFPERVLAIAGTLASK